MAEIRINSTGELKLYDSDDSNYVSFKSGGTVSSNVTWTLPTADGSDGQVLTTDGSGTLSWATASSADPASADGDSLGTASAEWSDLFLADGGTIQFGNDQDVTLTHVADTALLLNAAMRLQFRDSGLYIGSNADGDLDIVSDGTAVDSINLESAGGITLDAGTASSGIVYEDDGTEMLRIHNSSSDVIVESKVSDKDIIFKGNDGGSAVTAWTMDMSAGGHLLPGNAATGIYLGVNSATSSNLLHDYEEGEFANALSIDSTTQTSYSSGRSHLKYVKIGSFVHCSGLIDTENETLGDTGQIYVRLPFSVASSGSNSYNASKAFSNVMGGNDTHPGYFYVQENDTICEFDLIDTSGSTAIDGSGLSVSSTSDRVFMFLDITYQTDA